MVNHTVALAELSPIMEEILESGGDVTFTITGTSMLPMLFHRKDKVILVKPTAPLKKYDLPLYLRDNGQYVLHRIIQVKKDGNYIMSGDNQVWKEDGIRPDQIIGVVKGFYRKGHYYDSSHIGYQIYCHIWVDSFYIRKTYRFFKALPKRAFRYIKKRITK